MAVTAEPLDVERLGVVCMVFFGCLAAVFAQMWSEQSAPLVCVGVGSCVSLAALTGREFGVVAPIASHPFGMAVVAIPLRRSSIVHPALRALHPYFPCSSVNTENDRQFSPSKIFSHSGKILY